MSEIAATIEAGWDKIPTVDGAIPAFSVLPRRAGLLPLIIVVHEVYGIRGHVDQVCLALGRLGYFAVAPLLSARYGDVQSLPDIDEIQKVGRRSPDAEVAADLDATIAWAAKTGRADMSRVGVTGFCWGGRQVWLFAAHNHAIRAGVAWYGGPLVGAATELRPRHPIDVVEALQAPVLGLYGGADAVIPRPMIEKMQRALAAANNPSEIQIYPDAPHGFHADCRPANFRAGPAADGWDRMLAWFRRHGVV